MYTHSNTNAAVTTSCVYLYDMVIMIFLPSVSNRGTDRYSGFYKHVEHHLIIINHPSHLYLRSLLILMPIITGNTLFWIVTLTVQHVSRLSATSVSTDRRKSLNINKFISQVFVKCQTDRNMSRQTE